MPLTDDQRDAVLAAHQSHRRAEEVAKVARHARAVAIYRASRQGASTRELAKILELSQPAVMGLIKLGRDISEGVAETSSSDTPQPTDTELTTSAKETDQPCP